MRVEGRFSKLFLILFLCCLHFEAVHAWQLFRLPVAITASIRNKISSAGDNTVIPRFTWKSMAVVIAACSMGAEAQAQIPTVEEYYAGSGTVVRKPPSQSPIKDDSKLLSMSISDNPRSLVKELPRLVQVLQQRLEAKDWDAVVSVIKTADGALKNKHFGAESNLDLASILDISNPQARELESLREELLFNLDQLKDNAVSNRVYFFNSEDLQQIKLIAAENGKELTDDNASIESYKLLDEVRSNCEKIASIVSKS